MYIVTHTAFLDKYADDPAAAPGRIESIINEVRGMKEVKWVKATPATMDQILACHTESQVARVTREGVHDIAALSAGGAILAARRCKSLPAFAIICPPGHHASPSSSWGFCHYSNMAIALMAAQSQGEIKTAMVIDFDMHFGEGTVNSLIGKPWVRVYNPEGKRAEQLEQVKKALASFNGDCIAFSAGFDNHFLDWGGVLETEDYHQFGYLGAKRAKDIGARVFGILEGGYNHEVLGGNVRAFLEGIKAGWSNS